MLEFEKKMYTQRFAMHNVEQSSSHEDLVSA